MLAGHPSPADRTWEGWREHQVAGERWTIARERCEGGGGRECTKLLHLPPTTSVLSPAGGGCHGDSKEGWRWEWSDVSVGWGAANMMGEAGEWISCGRVWLEEFQSFIFVRLFSLCTSRYLHGAWIHSEEPSWLSGKNLPNVNFSMTEKNWLVYCVTTEHFWVYPVQSERVSLAKGLYNFLIPWRPL